MLNHLHDTTWTQNTVDLLSFRETHERDVRNRTTTYFEQYPPLQIASNTKIGHVRGCSTAQRTRNGRMLTLFSGMPLPRPFIRT